MSKEIVRPDGFPLSENEYRQMKRARMSEAATGKLVKTYSEWSLRGAPGEPLDPTMALAIFPTPAKNGYGYVFEPEFLDISSHELPDKYWQEILGLEIPRRVFALEGLQYRQAAELGDQILDQMVSSLMKNIRPSAMILFSRPTHQVEESAYLISPTLIPPSAAFRHIQLYARTF